MKAIFSILVALLVSNVGFGQSAIEKFFKDYQNNEDFMSVYIAPKMFQSIANTSKAEQDEFMDIVKDIRGLRILSTEKNAMQVYKESNKRLAGSGYEELMTMKDKDQYIRFVTKESNGKISELLLLVGEEKEFTMMSFVGTIDLNKISKLASKLNVEGVEHLDKVKKK